MRTRHALPTLLAAVWLLAVGCRTAAPPVADMPVVVDAPAVEFHAVDPLVDTLQERSFRWFWDTAHPVTGLVPDRWPTPSFSSVAAVGFGLTAYVVGADRGWVSREDAAARTRQTLAFLYDAPQGDAPDATGAHGFFYHFLDMETGRRWERVELSTVDTALLVAGALSAAEYFDGDAPDEVELRRLANAL